MSKSVNFKKLTATSLLAFMMAGSFAIQPVLSANTNAPGQNKKACKNNNGIGNNYDIEVTLPSGTSLTIRIDPGNSGQMNKFAGYLAVTYNIDSTVFNTVIKPQIVDAEMRAKSGNTNCPSGSTVSTATNFTTNSNTGTAVSVELVLSVDVSGSVDNNEFLLQKNGYKAAFQDPAVIAAIKQLPKGLAVNMQFWASNSNILETTWYKLTDDASISSFVTKFDSVTRDLSQGKVKFGTSGSWVNTGKGTDLKLAIDKAKNAIVTNTYNGEALVIDVSGDGVSDDTAYNGGKCGHQHFCPPVSTARDQALAKGITINGLPIVNNQNTAQLTHEIDKHYQQLVIGGEDSFIEVARDFSSFTAAAKKKILKEITQAGNLAASAVDDASDTNEDTSTTVNVLANDDNPGNKALTVTQVNGVAANVGQQFSLGSGALLTVNSLTSKTNSNFTYNPNSKFEQLNDGESQLDSFTYTMSDGSNVSSATVSMSVAGVTDASPNQYPNAVNDTATTNQDSQEFVEIDVLGNDTDPDSVDKSKFVIVSVNANNANGEVKIENGKIKFKPTSGFSGSATFEYTMSDGQGGTDTASVSVDVEKKNTPPGGDLGSDEEGININKKNTAD